MWFLFFFFKKKCFPSVDLDNISKRFKALFLYQLAETTTHAAHPALLQLQAQNGAQGPGALPVVCKSRSEEQYLVALI